MRDLGKLIVAKGFENLPKVQYIAQSGHSDCCYHSAIQSPLKRLNRKIILQKSEEIELNFDVANCDNQNFVLSTFIIIWVLGIDAELCFYLFWQGWESNPGLQINPLIPVGIAIVVSPRTNTAILYSIGHWCIKYGRHADNTHLLCLGKYHSCHGWLPVLLVWIDSASHLCWINNRFICLEISCTVILSLAK